MTVIVLPQRAATRPERDIHRKWGIIAERIAGDEELRDAIRDVLLWEHYKHDRPPLLGQPADIAHADACFCDGWQQALATAADALTSTEYIRAMRGLIEERVNQPKEPEFNE